MQNLDRFHLEREKAFLKEIEYRDNTIQLLEKHLNQRGDRIDQLQERLEEQSLNHRQELDQLYQQLELNEIRLTLVQNQYRVDKSALKEAINKQKELSDLIKYREISSEGIESELTKVMTQLLLSRQEITEARVKEIQRQKEVAEMKQNIQHLQDQLEAKSAKIAALRRKIREMTPVLADAQNKVLRTLAKSFLQDLNPKKDDQ